MLRWSVETHVFFHLNDKTDLCAEAEVAHSQLRHFLDERFSGKLEFILTFLNEIFKLEGLQLHDRTDRKLACPLTLVQVTKDVLEVDRLVLGNSYCLLLLCKVYHDLVVRAIEVMKGVVRSFGPFFGDHALLELVQDRVQLTRGALDVRHRGLKLIG